MAKTIKLKDDVYFDSSAIMHNKELLKTILDKLLEVNSMTVGLNTNTNFTISTAWNYQPIPLDKLRVNTGSRLKFENNGIKIPAGVKRVRVSGNGMLCGIVGQQILLLTHNSTTISTGYAHPPGTGNWSVISLSPITIDVNEGDMIYLKYGAGSTGTLRIAGGMYTYLTVDVVELE